MKLIPCKVCGELQERKQNPPKGCICRSCAKKRRREYQREYYQRPEVKKRRRGYNKEYHQRPEVKKRMRGYMRGYMREYYQRPEVKKRMNALRVASLVENCIKMGMSKKTAEAFVHDGVVLDKRLVELKGEALEEAK